MTGPTIAWTFGGAELEQAAAAMARSGAEIAPAVEQAMSEIGDGLVAEILSYTPAPGVQEVPRTWVRTGRLAASIGKTVSRKAGTVTLVVESQGVPYAHRWIELGYRDDPRAGAVYMKVRPGGYRMFDQGRKWAARGEVRKLLTKALLRAVSVGWGRK